MNTPPVLPTDPAPVGGAGDTPGSAAPRPIPPHRAWLPVPFPVACLIAAGGLVALALLWHFEPRGQFFFPRCAFQQITGLQCPGCGGLRATHALLHGDVASAWRLNALWVAGLPIGAWSAGAWILEQRTGRRIPHPVRWRGAWIAAAVAILGFGLLRNL